MDDHSQDPHLKRWAFHTPTAWTCQRLIHRIGRMKRVLPCGAVISHGGLLGHSQDVNLQPKRSAGFTVCGFPGEFQPDRAPALPPPLSAVPKCLRPAPSSAIPYAACLEHLRNLRAFALCV